MRSDLVNKKAVEYRLSALSYFFKSFSRITRKQDSHLLAIIVESLRILKIVISRCSYLGIYNSFFKKIWTRIFFRYLYIWRCGILWNDGAIFGNLLCIYSDFIYCSRLTIYQNFLYKTLDEVIVDQMRLILTFIEAPNIIWIVLSKSID